VHNRVARTKGAAPAAIGYSRRAMPTETSR
jgi:hypothetical protein